MHEHVFVSKMHPRTVHAQARRMLTAGHSINAVARATGVPRSTVGYWRRRGDSRRGVHDPSPDWRPPSPASYCYLLGLYLGDGTISRSGDRSFTLRLYLDAAYPAIVEGAAHATSAVMPSATTRLYDYVQGTMIVHATHPDWGVAFPQHGPGKKHLRPIVLAGWQRDLCARHPRELLRGLIHSDGSRCLNRFSTRLPSGRVATYEYPRYFFTNYSADIRAIFCHHCDLLGIRWTQSSFKDISVAHRKSVALLDAFVGPKR